MRGRFGVLATILRSPTLLRLELAFVLFSFGEWATWVAVIVYAYGRGGAAEAGVVAFIELAPSVVLAPTVAGLGDRFPRALVLVATYAAQAILMAATAIALVAGASPLVVYLLATLTATAVALSRPVHASLLPEVVAGPDELTAANVVSGMAESGGSLLGPLGAGILITIHGPELVFVVTACFTFAAAILVSGPARRAIRDRRVDAAAAAAAIPVARAEEPAAGGLGEVLAGLAAIRADRRLRSVVAVAAWATFLVGALDIFYAVLAISLLGLGEGGVGLLGAVGGLGATLGAAAALVLVGRERLGVALGASAALFGLSIAAIAVVPGAIGAAALLLSAGLGAGLTAVAAQTMIQRLAGDDVMSRVFGVLQGLTMGSTAVGALAVPLLIQLVGERAAFAVAGVSLPLAFLALGRAILAADRLDPARAAELRLLRGVPMLGPLSAPVLERLAGSTVHLSAPAGSTIIRAGEPGDRFYVIEAGRVEVEVDRWRVRDLDVGDGFGEIALVRDVPRTATLRAITDARLLAIDREPFLAALTGQPRSRTLAAELAAGRLADDRSRA
jgi:MFS family permease